MITDIPQTIHVLKEALLHQLGDEVDLIFRYGSLLRGNTHRYSDLDISYVPAHDSTWHCITVTLDDILIDFYPIQWSRLEKLAAYDDLNATILFESQVIYQRTDAAGERFDALKARLFALQQPDAYPTMLAKAGEIFTRLGYPYYLLREQAEQGHVLAALYSTRHILRGVVHTLAALNQRVIDGRKIDQVLSLAKLPENFSDTVTRLIGSTDPAVLINACETLMKNTRALLLEEQRKAPPVTGGYREAFGSSYPELKHDVQHLIIACERGDLFNFNLTSLYHELMLAMAQASTGVRYAGFNSIADYEQDLQALGFPDLLERLIAGDYEGLKEQCAVFDQRLRQFLTEHEVPLFAYRTLDELRESLREP